jgi:hypothetical protein
MLKLIAMSVIGWALLSGVISRAQVTNATAPAIDVYDGFETTSLSKVWDTIVPQITNPNGVASPSSRFDSTHSGLISICDSSPSVARFPPSFHFGAASHRSTLG